MTTDNLAITMQVNKRDLQCLVNSVFNEIEKDGLAEHFCLVATQDERREIVCAYVERAVKKFESFSISYMTNDTKKKSFNESVRGLIDEPKKV